MSEPRLDYETAKPPASRFRRRLINAMVLTGAYVAGVACMTFPLLTLVGDNFAVFPDVDGPNVFACGVVIATYSALVLFPLFACLWPEHASLLLSLPFAGCGAIYAILPYLPELLGYSVYPHMGRVVFAFPIAAFASMYIIQRFSFSMSRQPLD